MKMKLALAGALLSAVTLPAYASTLFASDYLTSSTKLYTANQSTGALTAIGATARNVGDLASNATTLFGITLGGNNLVTIDPTTGAILTSVAVTGTRSGDITSLAFNTLTNTLYGNTTTGFGSTSGDGLYAINVATGVASFIGSIGFTNVYALATDTTGALFGISDASREFVRISSATGAGTLISSIGTGGWFDMAARPEDNVMFLSDALGRTLHTIDTTTGATSLVGSYGTASNIAGLAFLGGAVPEPSTWGMMLFGFGLVGSVLRRRRALATAIA
jgi:hypothetical protein